MMGNALEVFIMFENIWRVSSNIILIRITTYPEVLEVFRITGPIIIPIMRVALRDHYTATIRNKLY